MSGLVQDKMNQDEQLDAHRSELQKVRAKRRFINQHSDQLESDMRAASNSHEKLKDELQVVEFGVLKLNSELGALEQDCTRRRVQTLDKVCQLRLLHGKSSCCCSIERKLTVSSLSSPTE
jgi:septal ring factor EnvC (AmiA/AmiB activator)